MKNVKSLLTPSFLVDLDQLETNIADMQKLCTAQGVELWPMVKTHKSTAIARLQQQAGARGFLTGTLDEAEALIANGFTDIMLAYPVAAPENIARILALAPKAAITLSFDGPEAAQPFAEALDRAGLAMDYLLIIDSGLHRFGVPPEQAAELAVKLAVFSPLVFRGISTHPGHVYGAAAAEVSGVAGQEIQALQKAKALLAAAGFTAATVATGSTPTAALAAKSGAVSVLRPGNYVFYDALQVALGVVPEEACALTVLATVIAHPRPDLWLMDAGSKCFGLDKGAHGINLASGYGIIKGHPELVIEGLSEEVGKIRAQGSTALKVGDKIAIIPNHACSCANMTDYLIGHRHGQPEKIIAIDIRSGTRKPPEL